MPAKKVTRSDRIRRMFKAAQAAKGYTQADVAKRLNVTQSTVSNWYKSPDRITVGDLRLLCQVLVISPSDVFDIQ